MLPQAMGFCNGKGGAGKTSLSAHTAGMAAEAGWRTLAVDLDPQANLGADLGYEQEGNTDEGRSLHASIIAGAPLEPIRNVRPNLDVLAAGEEKTEELIDVLSQRQARDRERLKDLEAALATIADDYQLIVLDCPVNKVMEEAALAAAHWVIIPTRTDSGSRQKGLQRVARRFTALRDSGINPDLELLGVALFDMGASDTKIDADVRGELTEALDGIAPVFDGFIRNARVACKDMRDYGVLATEYDKAAKEYPGKFAGNAATLAADYQKLVIGQILPAVARSFEVATHHES